MLTRRDRRKDLAGGTFLPHIDIKVPGTADSPPATPEVSARSVRGSLLGGLSSVVQQSHARDEAAYPGGVIGVFLAVDLQQVGLLDQPYLQL